MNKFVPCYKRFITLAPGVNQISFLCWRIWNLLLSLPLKNFVFISYNFFFSCSQLSTHYSELSAKIFCYNTMGKLSVKLCLDIHAFSALHYIFEELNLVCSTIIIYFKMHRNEKTHTEMWCGYLALRRKKKSCVG